MIGSGSWWRCWTGNYPLHFLFIFYLKLFIFSFPHRIISCWLFRTPLRWLSSLITTQKFYNWLSHSGRSSPTFLPCMTTVPTEDWLSSMGLIICSLGPWEENTRLYSMWTQQKSKQEVQYWKIVISRHFRDF